MTLIILGINHKTASVDIRGQLVSTLVNKRLSSGQHKIVFDATALASGVYLYRLQTRDGMLSKKMTLIK